MIKKPEKPFPSYKWQWATVTCTEGLNYPPVFLGVLRALHKHVGLPSSSPEVIASLSQVEKETGSRVSLARSKERNLIRNSGQYWKALDLISDERGLIHLTPFGIMVADSRITPSEFAATVVKTLELPNKRIEHDISAWENAGLKIQPLELIISIISGLRNAATGEYAFITPYELVKIVIPLAGNKATVEMHVEAILSFRNGKQIVSEWPDCAPGANDKRMAREYLLFLHHYGICKMITGKSRDEERYYLTGLEQKDVIDLENVDFTPDDTLHSLIKIRESRIASQIDRKRIYSQVIARPQQPLFRQNVLGAYKSKCIITGVELSAVLEAAHIIPVHAKGKDFIANSFCFRSDIHLLFDSGHLRIDPTGKIHLSDTASSATNYGHLHRRITLPNFVDTSSVKWRWEYA